MTTKNQQVITGVRQEYWNALELIRNILNDSTLIAKDNDYIKVYKTLNEVLETLKPREADIVKHRLLQEQYSEVIATIKELEQKLSVTKNNFPDNPLVLEKVGNDILLQRGENEAHILNNSRVLIEDLNFENIIISNNPSRNILEASFTIASTTYKTSRLIR